MQNNIADIKLQFPIFKNLSSQYQLFYLDNAATTQKPQVVIDKLVEYYTTYNANIHRGVYKLSHTATHCYESAREIVRKFINAKHNSECIFVKSTTEAINLVAHVFGQAFLLPDDEVLITEMEHHANIVPWQLISSHYGTKTNFIPLKENGELDLEDITKFFTKKTKLLAICHVSNVFGTINPIKELINLAHDNGIKVLVDGAQAPAHIPVDVQDLDCDFYAFSGHKMYGPTGIGVLYGKREMLNSLPPYHGGGSMVLEVDLHKSSYQDVPYKFEAGTPAIASAIALGSAINFIQSIGYKNIMQHEEKLLAYATQQLENIPGLRILGKAKNKIGIINFLLHGIHPHDLATILDQYGIAVRAGNHCAMPALTFFRAPASTRISFGIYNDLNDIDYLIKGINSARKIFK